MYRGKTKAESVEIQSGCVLFQKAIFRDATPYNSASERNVNFRFFSFKPHNILMPYSKREAMN